MVGFTSFAIVGATAAAAATVCIPTVSATAAAGDEAELGPVDFFMNIIGMSATDNVVSSGTRSSGIQVIGGGNSKTGTKSLQLALEMLGHKIYDMQAIAGDEHIHFLEDVGLEPGPAPRKPRGLYPASKGDKARDEVFDQWHEAILEHGATATLDAPMCFFFEELLERNPTAKVILTTHPSEDSHQWLQSLEETWTAFAPISGGRPFSFLIDMMTWGDGVWPFVGCANTHIWVEPWWAPWVRFTEMSPFDDREACRQGYLDHNQRVRDVTPSDRLLEFNVKQGWAPLCSFLEVPAAECPSARGVEFPRVNQRDANKTIYSVARIIAYGYPFLPFVPFFVVYLLYKVICRAFCRGRPEIDAQKQQKKNK